MGGSEDLDRALARSLWESGVPEGPLQSLLAEVEGRADLSLAAAVVTRGLAPVDLVEAALRGMGGASPPLSQAPTGDLSDYEVVGVLGQGGMGVVHEVRHRRTGISYALKRTLAAADPDEHIRLIREAELLARLDHPGLVRVHSADFSGEAPAFVLELLEGGSLQDRIQTGPMPLDEARRVAEQVGEAVGYLHREGVLHRDLKPLNVLFDGQGNARLTDFGLARARGALTLTQTGELLGTPGYMAPEQVTDPRLVDARSDVYALGAILFALLTGSPPFQAGSALGTLDRVLHQAPPTLKESRGDDEASEFEALCAAALAKDPARRPQSAEEFVEALRVGGSGAGAPRALLAGVLALLVALALGLGVAVVVAAGTPTSLPTQTPPSQAPSLTHASPAASRLSPPSPTPGADSGLEDLNFERLGALGNREGGFDRLRELLAREDSLLIELYPAYASARRDAALIAALGSGSGDKVEGWWKGPKNPREVQGRRIYKATSRGERRALRSYAEASGSVAEAVHLLWLGALSGDGGCLEKLANVYRLNGQLEHAAAAVVILERFFGGRAALSTKARKELPSLKEARRLLQPALVEVRRAAPQPGTAVGVEPLSPPTIAYRIRALLATQASKERGVPYLTHKLVAARRLARQPFDEQKGKPRAQLFDLASGPGSSGEYFLASGLRGNALGLARFVLREVKRAGPAGGRKQRLALLVMALVALDSHSRDPAPLEPARELVELYRVLRKVALHFRLKPEAAAFLSLEASLFPLPEVKARGLVEVLGPLPPRKRAWEQVVVLRDKCLAVERGEATLDSLEPLLLRGE